MPEGIGWGERGICEVCVHVREQPEFYRWLVAERGYQSLMEPCEAPNQPPNGTHAGLSYVADPEGARSSSSSGVMPRGGWSDPGRTG